jgi:hypothetical protein
MYGLKPVPFTPFDFLRNGWNGGKGAENEEADRQLREWKDFPKPTARWTLDRV